MKQIKKQLAETLEKELGANVDWKDLEVPDSDHGDFAYPAMKAASKLGENPRKLAEKVQQSLNIDIVEKIEVAGPGYLNFHLDRKQYAEQISEAFQTERFGVEDRDGKILVEFSAPNLAKPMHIGHLRNNALGDSLQRIMRFVGYDVTSENYIGDWGTKHGQVIYAFKKWGSMQEFEENPMEHMYELYVKLNDEADEETKQKAREWSKKIEDGNKEAVELWEMFREATIEYNKQDYERMDISFDRWTGESVVAEDAEKIIKEGVKKGIFHEDDDGSTYVDFEDENLPSTVVKRSDGSTLYLSRDVANIRKRTEEGFDKNLYIVATEQNLHFRQLFNLAERFDITGMESEHISYGMLHLEEGSMSSSKGNIIKLKDVMDKAVQEAEKRVEGRDIGNPEAVGIGAVKYANLAVSRSKDIEFDWNQALSFEGDSGPYLQYSNTRAKSILADTDVEGEFKGDFDQKEYRLLKKISGFPESVNNAVDARDPAKIANYLSELCEEFNSFYHECPVLSAEDESMERRLKLVEMFVDVSNEGLELLGIKPLERM